MSTVTASPIWLIPMSTWRWVKAMPNSGCRYFTQSKAPPPGSVPATWHQPSIYSHGDIPDAPRIGKQHGANASDVHARAERQRYHRGIAERCYAHQSERASVQRLHRPGQSERDRRADLNGRADHHAVVPQHASDVRRIQAARVNALKVFCGKPEQTNQNQ